MKKAKRDKKARKLIRYLTFNGKRRCAERIFEAAFERVRQKIHGAAAPSQVLNDAIENTRPHIAIGRRRVGGVRYEVPVTVPKKTSLALAMRSIIKDARSRSGHGMASRLAKVILDAYRNEG